MNLGQELENGRRILVARRSVRVVSRTAARPCLAVACTHATSLRLPPYAVVTDIFDAVASKIPRPRRAILCSRKTSLAPSILWSTTQNCAVAQFWSPAPTRTRIY